MALNKDCFKYTDLSYFKETTKFMTCMFTFKVLFSTSAQINSNVLYVLSAKDT